ncbi:hypothetical protein PRIPAC_70741 [Pristionchus pacificus]|uniref:Uncharacterized protein n=1 Tax=Pristionchus pacificus TaxID=54126 RepID=A0A2A6BFR7_PRIPA|nr:hypothetical protein PRIPAC_70741 [Pristionchus pacificus]|eukprot:PDM64727.1 hypothetical protein PRIPAC_52983 [Pristionchus pacificus]
MPQLVAIGTMLNEDELTMIIVGLSMIATGFLMLPLINCYERMADARHRREALVVHDECIAPPVCDSIAREQKVKVPDWKDYFAADNTFE